MKIVLDTNVVVSRLFFGGYPGKILSAWHNQQLTLVLSASILAEYREVGTELNAHYGELDFEAFATLLVMHAEVVDAPAALAEGVCSDPDDDKFLACAAAAGAGVIVSGDRDLLGVSGWRGYRGSQAARFCPAISLISASRANGPGEADGGWRVGICLGA